MQGIYYCKINSKHFTHLFSHHHCVTRQKKKVHPTFGAILPALPLSVFLFINRLGHYFSGARKGRPYCTPLIFSALRGLQSAVCTVKIRRGCRGAPCVRPRNNVPTYYKNKGQGMSLHLSDEPKKYNSFFLKSFYHSKYRKTEKE